MSRTCSRKQVREIDRRAIEEYGMPGMMLMENAGCGAARIAAEMLGNPAKKSVAIFCGRGNNGGDGYVIARHLYNRGALIDLILACESGQVHPETDAGANLAIARRMGLQVRVALSQEGQLEAAAVAKQADLIVDALLGTGLVGEVREPYISLIRLINAADKPVLSVDIPSGLDADTGRMLRATTRATATATFVLPKQGFEHQDGPSHVGQVHVVDIGVPINLIEDVLCPPSNAAENLPDA